MHGTWDNLNGPSVQVSFLRGAPRVDVHCGLYRNYRDSLNTTRLIRLVLVLVCASYFMDMVPVLEKQNHVLIIII